MGQIDLENIKVRYGAFEAIHDLSLMFEHGKLTCVLGPSGAGKTSTLKAIAGFLSPSRGTIRIDGQDMTKVASQNRHLAMTFEGYNLYPHFTVFENLAFPLRSPKRRGEYDEARVRERVTTIAKMLEIDPLLDRYPKEISGGQKQRVGLGRMLVRENPAAYLMDEPIAHLDAKLRHQMIGEIKRIHTELQSTIVYATPDAEEALALADQVVFLNEGRIVQIGNPENLITQPENMFVAEFIGDPAMNFFQGILVQEDNVIRFNGEAVRMLLDKALVGPLLGRYRLDRDSKVNLGIRPQYCSYSFQEPSSNYIEGQMRVCILEPRGDSVVVTLEHKKRFYLLKMKEIDPALQIDKEVWMTADPGHFHLFDELGQNLIRK
jgi:multiple sugar transport system ATP-binding protein